MLSRVGAPPMSSCQEPPTSCTSSTLLKPLQHFPDLPFSSLPRPCYSPSFAFPSLPQFSCWSGYAYIYYCIHSSCFHVVFCIFIFPLVFLALPFVSLFPSPAILSLRFPFPLFPSIILPFSYLFVTLNCPPFTPLSLLLTLPILRLVHIYTNTPPR